jgi:tRNA G18 (ribose-2'-O)-methylase SpoU
LVDKELYILINNIRSLYNIGSIFRTAEAVGVNKIFLGGYSGVAKIGEKITLHPKLEKTALEGIHVPWQNCPDIIAKINDLKKNGITIYSLEITSGAQEYSKVKYKFPLCLVVGHEREGIEKEIINLSDQTIYIPMQGKGNSLNVSVATAVALYKIKERI